MDRTAKESTIFGIPVEVRYSLSELKSDIRRLCGQMWQREWNRCKGVLPRIKPLIQDWSHTYGGNRREQVVLARLRLGAPLFEVVHYIENSPRRNCLHCNARLTMTHIFIVCPLFSRQSTIIQKKCFELSLSFDISNILSSAFPEKLIIHFLKVSNIFSMV